MRSSVAAALLLGCGCAPSDAVDEPPERVEAPPIPTADPVESPVPVPEPPPSVPECADGTERQSSSMRFLCEADSDCTNSCMHGAINQAWFGVLGAGCKDGCSSKGIAPARCVHGVCTAFRRDGTVDEGCTGRPLDERSACVESATKALPIDETTARTEAADPFVAEFFAAAPAAVREDPDAFRFQLRVTEIIPGASEDDAPRLVEHRHAVDRWFYYPASAIKTFAAVSALRRVQRLRGKGVRADTPVAFCKAVRDPCHDPATADEDEALDESNVDGGTITLEHEIRKMLLVSDNRAFYRLFTFLGHQAINEDPWALGFSSVRMFQPYYVVRSPERSRRTSAVELRPTDGDAVLVPRRQSPLVLEPNTAAGTQVGTHHMADREVVEGPRSFAEKNYASIEDLHALTLSIARPELPGARDLGLTRAHRGLLRAAMTETPRRSKNPELDSPRYEESRSKLMIAGLTESVPRWRLTYTGKHGRAYGFVVESAYVRHRKTGYAAVVTAAIYVNADGIVGNDVYEYDEIAQPVFDALGRTLARRMTRAAEAHVGG